MSEMSELITIRDFLRYATSRFVEAGLFYGHGTTTAWDEALALILHSLHLPHDINPAILDAKLTKDERGKISDLINRRIKDRIPVPYLTHEAWFAGLSFYVDERVLIPRSPIAELIEDQFEPWVNPEKVHRILDLCTGSGCIAIACALAFPQAEVIGSDVSEETLHVAKINVLRHKVEDQVKLIQSDLFENIPKEKFDIIVTNPPYVDAEDMATLPPEYKHEPQLALAAGNDGLTIVKRILQLGHHFLSAKGIIVIEVGNSEFALAQQFPEIPFTWIDFKRGDGGVFLLTKEELVKAQSILDDQHVR